MAIVKWVLSLTLGGFLIFFGAMKFAGGAHIFPFIEHRAEAMGLPFAGLFYPIVNWATGALELLAGVLVILPATRRIGAALAAAPFLGAVGFHLSPLLGVSTPNGYADPPPAAALEAGGPFLREHFTQATSPVLFTIALAMLVAALVNAALHRRA
ncbi:MAG: hypothetical protein AAGC56_07220 [Pseudomonadota bacterium]